MATVTTSDAEKRARLTLTVTPTSTGASWAASVTDNTASYSGFGASGAGWTVTVAGTTVATASNKSYDFGSGNVASPYFPRSASGTLALSPGTYTASASFTGAGVVGSASIAPFSFTVVAATFSITFTNPNGSGGSFSETGLTAPASTTMPNPGSRTGYTFYGWQDSSSGLYYQKDTTVSNINSARTFTAVWTVQTYTVSYNANGGTGTMSDTTWTYPTTSGTVSANGFSRTGYSFAGYNTALNGTGTWYYGGNTISSSATLYAQWTANTGTVYYNGNGNDGGSTANTTWTYPSTSGTVRANGYTRTGYTFARWNTQANGAGTDYYPGGTTPGDGTTLYALWSVSAIYPSFTDTTVSSPGTLNIAYSDGVSASNATSYSVISGSLPTGLSLNTGSGVISGTPTAQGTYTFSIRATSSTANTADSGSLTIIIYPAGKRPSTNTRLTTAKRFNGTAWVNLTVMKRFDGSNWVNITNT